MTFDEARRALGIQPLAYTEDDVRRAYGSAVKLAHPDVGGGSGSEGANLARLREAKDTLLKLVSVENLLDGTCIQCKGTGQTRGMLLNRVCPSCKGSGKDASLSRR